MATTAVNLEKERAAKAARVLEIDRGDPKLLDLKAHYEPLHERAELRGERNAEHDLAGNAVRARRREVEAERRLLLQDLDRLEQEILDLRMPERPADAELDRLIAERDAARAVLAIVDGDEELARLHAAIGEANRAASSRERQILNEDERFELGRRYNRQKRLIAARRADASEALQRLQQEIEWREAAVYTAASTELRQRLDQHLRVAATDAEELELLRRSLERASGVRFHDPLAHLSQSRIAFVLKLLDK